MAPSSLTFGIEAGRGAGSRKGWDEDSPGWKELIVAAVGVVSCHQPACSSDFPPGVGRTGRVFPIFGSALPTPQPRRDGAPD